MAIARLKGDDRRIENIFCIGRNYDEHIKELNHERDSEIIVFLKPTSSVVNTGIADKEVAKVVLPNFSTRVDYEAEMLLLIGKDADKLDPSNALEVVAGVGIGIDLTARDTQSSAREKGLPWLKAKGFKHSSCISDFISPEELENLSELEFNLAINSETKQAGNTRDMLYSVEDILIFLAEVYGLKQGDLIFTGTPKGVGKLESGDLLHLNLADKVEAKFKIA